MEGYSLRGVVAELMPAILAGLIGGFGAYIAVKVDIAVLLNNQTALIEQGKIVHAMVARHDSDINLLKYRVDEIGRSILVKR